MTLQNWEIVIEFGRNIYQGGWKIPEISYHLYITQRNLQDDLEGISSHDATNVVFDSNGKKNFARDIVSNVAADTIIATKYIFEIGDQGHYIYLYRFGSH